jgi:hypothetical protein
VFENGAHCSQRAGIVSWGSWRAGNRASYPWGLLARFPVALTLLAAGFLACAAGATDSGAGSAKDQEIAEELKAPSDPTIMKRHVWLETEWNHYSDDSNNIEETFGGLWAWRVATNMDWGVRFKVPWEWHVAGHDAGDSDENGLGDIKLATGTAYRVSDRWRTAGGLELRMPTAQNDMGDKDWRLQEFVAGAWDAKPWLTLSPSAEYNLSVAKRSGGSWHNYLELYAPATLLLPHHWSVTPRYEAKIDFEDDNYVTHSARLFVVKQFADPPLGLSLSIKRSFDGGEKEFQVNFVITHYFH